MPSFRSPSLVLRSYDFSEADRVLVLFTREYGKVRALARGVRRLGSRLGGGLGLLSLAEVQWHGQEHRDLCRVTQVQLLASFPRLKADLPAFGRAARLAELLLHFTADRQPLPEVFDLAQEALSLLEAGVAPAAAGSWFEMTLLDHLGYRPGLEACQRCGSTTARQAYHVENGGLLCRGCRPSGGLGLTPAGRRILEGLLNNGPAWVSRLRLSPSLEQEVENVLNAALQYQLGRKLKSDGFRQAVAGLAPGRRERVRIPVPGARSGS